MRFDVSIAVNFLAPDLRESEPFVFAPKSPQVFSPLFSRAEKAWKEKRPAYEEKCLEILYAVLAAMTFPYVFYSTGNFYTALIGTGVAIIAALCKRSMLTVAILACIAVFISGFIIA